MSFVLLLMVLNKILMLLMVDVVVVVIFICVEEAVVPRCTNCSVNDARFLVVLLLVIGFVVVSISGC